MNGEGGGKTHLHLPIQRKRQQQWERGVGKTRIQSERRIELSQFFTACSYRLFFF